MSRGSVPFDVKGIGNLYRLTATIHCGLLHIDMQGKLTGKPEKQSYGHTNYQAMLGKNAEHTATPQNEDGEAVEDDAIA